MAVKPRLHLTPAEQRGLGELLDLLPPDERDARLPEVLEQWKLVCIARRKQRQGDSTAGLPSTDWAGTHRIPTQYR